MIRLAVVCGGLVLTGLSSPAKALERLVLRMPILETSVTINLAEAGSAAELVQSSPDLADLQEVCGGKLLDLIGKVFLAPLPLETKAFLMASTGQQLLEQASIDLSKVAVAAKRLKANQEQGVALAKAGPAETVTTSMRIPLKLSWTREIVRVAVTHRPQPLKSLT